jgi:hypothetical protein
MPGSHSPDETGTAQPAMSAQRCWRYRLVGRAPGLVPLACGGSWTVIGCGCAPVVHTGQVHLIGVSWSHATDTAAPPAGRARSGCTALWV